MAERVSRLCIIDDNKGKRELLTRRFSWAGAVVSLVAQGLTDVEALIASDALRPTVIDAVLIDGDIDNNEEGGKRIRDYLVGVGLLRDDFGTNRTELNPDAHTLLSIGTSLNRPLSLELGNYSATLGPLVTPSVGAMERDEYKLKLAALVDEVQRLKPVVN